MRATLPILFGLLLATVAANVVADQDAGSALQETAETRALSLTLEFAEYGDMAAQFNLASAYEFGAGVPQDHTQAVYWYSKAAEQGLAAAQSNLGVMYAEGKGTPRDIAKAVHWYMKAAQQGDAKAQNNLGAEYYRGRAIPRDDIQAYRWWRLAAAQGNENALRNLDMLEKGMTAAQISEAQALFGSAEPLVPANARFSSSANVHRSRICHDTVSTPLPGYPSYYD